MTIHVLTLNIENNGLSSSAHRTREGADAALYAYVHTNWGYEMLDTPMPEDKDEAIEAYFNESEDRAEIEAVELVD